MARYLLPKYSKSELNKESIIMYDLKNVFHVPVRAFIFEYVPQKANEPLVFFPNAEQTFGYDRNTRLGLMCDEHDYYDEEDKKERSFLSIEIVLTENECQFGFDYDSLFNDLRHDVTFLKNQMKKILAEELNSNSRESKKYTIENNPLQT